MNACKIWNLVEKLFYTIVFEVSFLHKNGIFVPFKKEIKI